MSVPGGGNKVPDRNCARKEKAMTATVLVVCADPLDGADWELLLVRQGYEVVTVRTGESALTVCSKLQPDLILLDDTSPAANGHEIRRQLRNDPSNRLTPILLISAPESPCDCLPGFQPEGSDVWGMPPTSQQALDRFNSLL